MMIPGILIKLTLNTHPKLYKKNTRQSLLEVVVVYADVFCKPLKTSNVI